MKKVKVFNKTKESILLPKVYVAESFFNRLKGLMGTKNLDSDRGLLIRPCNSVHTFFMKFPIDVAFIDKNGQICHIIHSMKKNRVSPIVPKAFSVLEAPSATFKACNLELEDMVELFPFNKDLL